MADFTIDPSEVALSTRASWCASQLKTCSTLCDSNPEGNSCDSSTLDYDCTCQNGSAPGLVYYSQTMPTYICHEAFADCISENANSLQGQQTCTTTIADQCGTLDVSSYVPSSGSSSSDSTSLSATTAVTSTSQQDATSETSTLSSSLSTTIPIASTGTTQLTSSSFASSSSSSSTLLSVQPSTTSTPDTLASSTTAVTLSSVPLSANSTSVTHTVATTTAPAVSSPTTVTSLGSRAGINMSAEMSTSILLVLMVYMVWNHVFGRVR